MELLEGKPPGSGGGYLDFCGIMAPWYLSGGFIARTPYTTSCSEETGGRRLFSAKKTASGSR